MKDFFFTLVLFGVVTGCATIEEERPEWFSSYHEFDALKHDTAVSKAVLYVLSTPTNYDHVGGPVT